MNRDFLDKGSLRERIFDKIREDILAGNYKQNEELKEVAIGNDFGVSRTPVREALRQLELEGLVTIIPNKGAYVTGITAKDIEDIYEARSVLEGLCAKRAAKFIEPHQLKLLDDYNELSEFYEKKDNYEQVWELDSRFHEMLYQASNSKILEHLLSNFHHYVQRVRKVSLATEGRAKKSNEEHKLIVDAIKEKNPDLAGELANQHVMNTIKNIDTYGLKNILDASSNQV